jgi:hypothetical protein
MKKTIKNYCLGSAVALCLAGNASAAWSFADGDMMLGFHASAGEGFQENLMFNLGSSVSIRDGVITGFRGNINDDLVATYGSNWFTRTDLTFGAIANRTTLTPTQSAAFTTGQQDPNRIAYITRTAATPGAAADHPTITGQTLGTALTGVTTLEGILANLTETGNGDGAALFARTDAQAQWDQASWSTRVPASGSSFTSFQNIGTAFGAGGDKRYADIQRIGGTATGITYSNITVSTIQIDNLGNISLVPEPSSLTLAGLAALALVTRRRR